MNYENNENNIMFKEYLKKNINVNYENKENNENNIMVKENLKKNINVNYEL